MLYNRAHRILTIIRDCMKPIFLSIFVLIFLPHALSVASSTAEQELGADTPESQLLTVEEIATYKRLNPGFLGKRNGMERVLRSNGLHIFTYLPEPVDPNCTIDCPADMKIRLYPEQRMVELYYNPNQIREGLNEASEEKKICCLIL